MIKELIRKNRSYREFDESYRFTRAHLMDYVDAARFTASAVNRQPLRFYIAYSQEDTDKITSLIRLGGLLKDRQLPEKGKAPTGYIVICHDMNVNPNVDSSTSDTALAAQAITLLACEEGLGGCLVGNFRSEELSEALNLQASYVPKLVVALGKPAETVVLKDVDEKTQSTVYYRDENDVHYVPKRLLKDLIINTEEA